ncbi:MAG TPA: NHL repeat-containing protein [Verrucomicrobiae bacterium]|nr:NHL repeat-containing protein [Verrucomicrobiae bacterium]
MTALGGSTTVSPTAVGAYDYTLTCLGSNGSTADTATLGVQAAAGTTATARFNNPHALVVDSAGNIFVADSSNHTIRKITPTNGVTTFAGLAGSSGAANGTGVIARFNAPHGIAINAADTLFLADSLNHTLRAVTPAAAVTTLAGVAGSIGSGNGTGTAARFTFPFGVVTDSAGNLFVVDHDNNTIRRVTPGGDVTTLAGIAGVTGSADGTGAAASFNGPRGIAIDASDNLYVADFGNYTLRMITSGGVVTTLAGTAGAPITFGNGDGTGAAARFSGPSGVATDSLGNIFVTDINGHTIRKVTPAGVVTTFAGSSPGSANGNGTSAQFRIPDGIAIDASDNLYIADTFNCTIRKITPAADVTTVAGQALSCGSTN